MGIFSFFSREEDDEDEYEEEQTQEAGRQPESALTGELFKGMRMDVTDKEGLPLLSGKVSEKSPDSLSLTRLPGELSFKIVTIGTTVNINGFDKKLIPISLSGTVQESSRTIFKLKNLKVESHAENRDNFRLPYTAPVSLFRKEDDHFRHPEECTLINISTGGCCRSMLTLRTRCCASGSSWTTTPLKTSWVRLSAAPSTLQGSSGTEFSLRNSPNRRPPH